jgi:flagellar basal body-associated protein FliL
MTRVPNNEEMKMPEEQFGGFTQEDKSSHLGVILGVLIVVLMLILGGLYLWSTSLQDEMPVVVPDTQRPTAEENNEPESNNAEADAQALETTSTSDEIDAIEADIQSSNIDTVDSDMQALDALLQ